MNGWMDGEGGGWGEGAGKVFLPETFDKNQKLLILKKNSPICFKVLIRLYSKLSFKSLLNFNQKVFTWKEKLLKFCFVNKN